MQAIIIPIAQRSKPDPITNEGPVSYMSLDTVPALLTKKHQAKGHQGAFKLFKNKKSKSKS